MLESFPVALLTSRGASARRDRDTFAEDSLGTRWRHRARPLYIRNESHTLAPSFAFITLCCPQKRISHWSPFLNFHSFLKSISDESATLNTSLCETLTPGGRSMARGKQQLRRLDRWVGIPLVYVIGKLKRHRSLPSKVERIVLLQTAAIGDTVLMAGPVEDLRKAYSNAEIILACGRDNRGAAALLPAIDKFVDVRPGDPVAALMLLRSLKPDLVIDFGPWPRINALLTALSGASYSVGFRSEGQHRHFAYDGVVDHSRDRHELQNQRALVAAVMDGVEHSEPRLQVGGVRAEWPHSKHFIVFHAWASGFQKRLKEWPIGHWVELARWATNSGYEIALTGGPSDSDDARELEEAIRTKLPSSHVRNYTGILSLTHTCQLLSAATAVVSVNTGIMHIAALLGALTIGICGPTSPKRWGPLGTRAVAVAPPGGDHGYLHLGFEFPRDAQPCMPRVTPQRVIDALECAMQQTLGRQA
jgi:heptosyltransferase-3